MKSLRESELEAANEGRNYGFGWDGGSSHDNN
jgi:hypothetical protein